MKRSLIKMKKKVLKTTVEKDNYVFCIWKGIFGDIILLEKSQRIKCFLLYSWYLFFLNNAKESVSYFTMERKVTTTPHWLPSGAVTGKRQEHKLNGWRKTLCLLPTCEGGTISSTCEEEGTARTWSYWTCQSRVPELYTNEIASTLLDIPWITKIKEKMSRMSL